LDFNRLRISRHTPLQRRNTAIDVPRQQLSACIAS
jgi:hypothetical protein